MANEIMRLQNWFARHCDGNWEHQQGIKIETLDNPGWAVTIDLAGTSLAGAAFESVKVDAGEDDWIACHVESSRFEGFGAPLKLEEILDRFLTWAAATSV